MLVKNSYLILDNIPKKSMIPTKLCILNLDLKKSQKDEISSFINKYPETEFWLVTNNSSREIVKLAQEVGITNIIDAPIDIEFVDKYLENDIQIVCKHAPIDNSLSCKVVIVDDNIMNIKLLEEILSDFTNLDICSYQKPELILDELESQKFDLFLVDVLMPNMSGFELAEKIKISKINSSTPIVFISAMSDTENKLNGYNLGAYSYIEKPYNVEVVKSQIYNLLKNIDSNKLEESLKDSFVAMLTHDLKSPINAEIRALELLMGHKFGEISNCQNEVIGGVLNSAKYMKQITDQILSHYKLKNGKIELKKERCCLETLVKEAVEEMRFLFEEKSQKVKFKCKVKNTDTCVDTIEIKRVLINLLSNAIEYSPTDSKISIELSKSHNFYVLKVKDSGYGVDVDNKDTVFNEYMSMAKKYKKIGFGLGLNICKLIISAHGGSIEMDSKPQKGTVVKFTLPVEE